MKGRVEPGQNNTGMLIRLLILLLALSGAVGSEEGKSEGPPPPKLKDVKVWYYPPSGRPITIIWWQPDRLNVDHRMEFDRQGRFRVRVEMAGGVEYKGRVVNFISIVFRDQNSNMHNLPLEQSMVTDGVKDIYWSPPSRFASGTLDFQVGLWNEPLPRVSLNTELMDQTDFLILGRLRFPGGS